MLDEQFFSNTDYHPFLKERFVSFKAVKGEGVYMPKVKEYGITAVPTVLILKPDGAEIDRNVGYPGSPEAAKETLIKICEGKNTYLYLQEESKNNPGNIEIAAKLAIQYESRNKTEEAARLFEKILSNPEKSRNILVPSGRNGPEVSAYEYAKYAGVTSDLLKLPDFFREFPESVFKDRAISNFYLWYRDENTVEKAVETFDKLYKMYPDNYRLLSGYISYCIESGKNLEKAEKLVRSAYSPEYVKQNQYFPAIYAIVMMKNGKEKDALSVFGEKFVNENYDNSGLLSGYSVYWAEQKTNLESALKAAERAVEIDKSQRTLRALGNYHWKTGNLEKAISLTEEALKLDPNSRAAKIQLENIKKDIKKK
ncbi:tetratricopeptide repeat protein [candidate division KSB1 bacterium]